MNGALVILSKIMNQKTLPIPLFALQEITKSTMTNAIIGQPKFISQATVRMISSLAENYTSDTDINLTKIIIIIMAP